MAFGKVGCLFDEEQNRKVDVSSERVSDCFSINACCCTSWLARKTLLEIEVHPLQL